MDKDDLLFQIADHQQGYFTSQQAAKCGFLRFHFHRYLLSGEWVREQRGIYRLTRYPMTERPELTLWSLWSRNKLGKIQGVWSHETALDIYELSDVMPSKMHMTVPKSFRKNVATPSVLVLHYSNLSKPCVQAQQGYLITTPLQTLIDVENEGTLAPDLILQALKEALRRGIISQQQIETTPQASKLKVFLNETKI